MKVRKIYTVLRWVGLVAVLALGLSMWFLMVSETKQLALAQPSDPVLYPHTTPTAGPSMPLGPMKGRPFHEPAALDAQSSPGADAVALGQPGLSFRYVRTFGVTEEPYLEDNNHFYEVEGLGVEGNNIWVTDAWGDRVVKFDAGGNFLQKIGKAGVTDYTGTSLDYVTDVAVDGEGNIWVVDGSAAHVVKYNPNGQKVTELGQAWNRGPGNNQFSAPISIAFDSAGNIYISDSGLWGDDYGNHRVQVFDSAGNYLTTIGQTGVCGTANNQLCGPRHIATYGNRLYVADSANHRVQIFDISTPSAPAYVATLGVTGQAGSDDSHFDHPEGVGVDTNYIYVADSNNNRVQVFDRTTLGYVATLGTGYGQGDYQFNHPTDVVVDSTGRIYIADNWNKRVQQYDAGRNYLRTYGTTGVSYVTDGYHYYFPSGVAVAQDGSIYIVEERGHRMVKLNAAGTPQWTIGDPGQAGSDNGHFFGPKGVAVGSDGRIYTVESWGNHRVQIFNPDGTYYGGFGGWGDDNYHFKSPSGLTVDGAGNLYIADTGNHRVQIYDNQLAYVATLGGTGTPGSDNAHFNNPFDVAVDRDGYIYVADEGNARVQVFDKNRQYVRTIGGGSTGDDFGHFSDWGPHHLAVDRQGRLYVVDSGNSRVQVFDNFANGNAYLTTIGGSWGQKSGQFSNVMGIAVGPDGNVYTTEINNNHRIQKFAPGTPGWKQVNINGFGDRANQVNSLTSFVDHLYAGTFNFSGGGAQLWRMDISGNWTAVMTDGFGNSKNVGIDHLQEFDGQLYAGTWADETNGGEIWRSNDGIHWVQVVDQGFGDPTNAEVIRLAVFNNQVYAATWSYTSTHGAEIWRSETGDANDWTQVVSNGLGDASNEAVINMEVFNGALYASTYSFDDVSRQPTGCEVWRTADGVNWSRVVTDGFGNPTCYAAVLSGFGDYLYAGLHTWDPGTNTFGPAQIWRCAAESGCDEPSDWEQVIDNGFGNPDNSLIDGLEESDGFLYATAYNRQTGLEVWRTANGTDWVRVGAPGFGDSNNHGLYWNNSVAVFNDTLYIGTVNGANGGEIWKRISFFDDVSMSHWAHRFIERLFLAGVTGGCGVKPLRYCPDAPVTRAQMAVFLEKGMHYPSTYSPPDVGPTFPDTAGHWAEDWIEALKSDGITSGFPDGTYRPESPVTRAQMAVFLLKAKHGASYQPPAVGHSRFSDVPDDHWAKAWIEELAAEGITSGYPDGTYKPENPVSRAEMSVFLVKTFGLP